MLDIHAADLDRIHHAADLDRIHHAADVYDPPEDSRMEVSQFLNLESAI